MSDAEAKPDDLTLKETIKELFKASRGFWLVNMVNFGDGICYFGILTLLTRFLGTRLRISDYVTGLSVSMYTGMVTLFMLGGGFISDKLGVRKALTLSLSVIGIGRIILAGTPWGMDYFGVSKFASWGGLFLMAFGTGVLQPALYAGIKEYTDPRTATIGYGLLYSIMNLGIVAESFISPFIRTDAVFLNLKFTQIVGLGWGIDGVYWLCVFITGLLLLLHLSLFTRKVEITERRVVVPDEGKEQKLSLKEKMRELPFLDPQFMFFIFILVPVRTMFAHDFLTIPDYIFRAYPPEVGAKYEWLTGINPLIIVLFVPTIAALTRKAKIINMMIIGTSVTATIGFLLTPGPRLWALLTYMVVFSFGEAIWSSRFLEYVAQLAPPGKVGAYMGLGNLPWFLAKFTTGFYSGYMLEHFVPRNGVQNSGTLWLIYASIACTSPIGLILAKRWLEKGEKTKV
jgi:dipeptide/tripeptide permease